MNRERELILKGSPCNVDYFDRDLLTVQQVIESGQNYRCINLSQCQRDDNTCALQLGLQIAQYVVQGNSLEKEMKDFAEAPFIEKEFWNSVDGKEFKVMQGKAEMLRAVEGFARVILLMDPFESIYNLCEKCGGARIVETVYDSIHDSPLPCAGSGRTVTRDVEYCPKCDPKPRGGILKEDPADAKEREFLRKLSQKD